MIATFFYLFLWMIATLATDKISFEKKTVSLTHNPET